MKFITLTKEDSTVISVPASSIMILESKQSTTLVTFNYGVVIQGEVKNSVEVVESIEEIQVRINA